MGKIMGLDINNSVNKSGTSCSNDVILELCCRVINTDSCYRFYALTVYNTVYHNNQQIKVVKC